MRVSSPKLGASGLHGLTRETSRWGLMGYCSSWLTTAPECRRTIGSGSSIRSSPPKIRGRAPGWGWRSSLERCTKAEVPCGWTGREKAVRCSKCFYQSRVRPMRLLIVDDDAGFRQSLALLLGESGYAVEVEGDPERALARASAEDFDLILCDVKMPSMDGLSFLRRFRDAG